MSERSERTNVTATSEEQDVRFEDAPRFEAAERRVTPEPPQGATA